MVQVKKTNQNEKTNKRRTRRTTVRSGDITSLQSRVSRVVGDDPIFWQRLVDLANDVTWLLPRVQVNEGRARPAIAVAGEGVRRLTMLGNIQACVERKNDKGHTQKVDIAVIRISTIQSATRWSFNPFTLKFKKYILPTLREIYIE